jgi:ATP-dependent NAD(P)H-hydrate dehydratase
VFTTPSAAPVIKGYSPDLVVRPLLEESRVEELLEGLGRCHAAVIGPGLGVSPEAQSLAHRVMRRLVERRIPMVVDADALRVMEAHPRLLHEAIRGSGLQKKGPVASEKEGTANLLLALPPALPVVVLTPNAMELRRLHASILQAKAGSDGPEERPTTPEAAAVRAQLAEGSVEATCFDVAQATGCFVLAKGQPDIIAVPPSLLFTSGSAAVPSTGVSKFNPLLLVTNPLFGSMRRCAGQGDVLAGILGAFLSWTHLPTCQGLQGAIGATKATAALPPPLSSSSVKVQAAIFAASTVMRLTQHSTFTEPGGPGRGYIASDLLQRLPIVATRHIGSDAE